MSDTGSAELIWRKSTRCESQHCVEMAQVRAGVAVRDSVNPEQSVAFSATAWQAFVDTLRAGR
ncbi:DUF397 domain-containing protein [Plantactinospora sp. S1510]|uniref:DUF397 domain-containing protein n=1 Tax=Plantactinospora alkalitolerans TaxID=2789879 RepID=A0ABS0H1Q5_9ACTN|nr:DUF397 domain-containing protein [Plantactinospora alkalitolerans]MBF9132393.1 DUF397 domain-containing protein [Plantactinospora alkalitolerans]